MSCQIMGTIPFINTLVTGIKEQKRGEDFSNHVHCFCPRAFQWGISLQGKHNSSSRWDKDLSLNDNKALIFWEAVEPNPLNFKPTFQSRIYKLLSD
jgi:hypothetical protein